MAGILILIFGFIAGFFCAIISFYLSSSKEKIIATYNEAQEEIDYLTHESSFYKHINFNGKFVNDNKMKPLPEGKGYLTGKFLYNNKPAPGITFKMILNNIYRTDLIRTDNQGSFAIKLPPGKWFITLIQCRSWMNKPKGRYILLSGDEKIKEKVSWGDLYSCFYGTGKEVLVTEEKPEKEQIILTINPRIKIKWPEMEISKQKATIANSKISWEPFPNAKIYGITIYRVSIEGGFPNYWPIIYTRISGTDSLPISKLPYIQDPVIQEEYAVAIEAYDDSGQLLSESDLFPGTFILTDSNVLVEKGPFALDYNQANIQQLYLDTKIINTIEILIKEKNVQ